jgi:hypothetical protein
MTGSDANSTHTCALLHLVVLSAGQCRPVLIGNGSCDQLEGWLWAGPQKVCRLKSSAGAKG